MSTSGAYTVDTVAAGGMTVNLEFVTADHPTILKRTSKRPPEFSPPNSNKSQ